MTSPQRSSWAVGYAMFAAIMLMVIGALHVFVGIVAIVKDTFYVVGQEWVFQFDVTAWGWIHLVVGIVVFISGIGIFSGNVAARTVGVIVAALSAVASFLWLPYYPVWAILIFALDIAVIWALSLHGRDIVAEV